MPQPNHTTSVRQPAASGLSSCAINYTVVLIRTAVAKTHTHGVFGGSHQTTAGTHSATARSQLPQRRQQPSRPGDHRRASRWAGRRVRGWTPPAASTPADTRRPTTTPAGRGGLHRRVTQPKRVGLHPDPIDVTHAAIPPSPTADPTKNDLGGPESESKQQPKENAIGVIPRCYPSPVKPPRTGSPRATVRDNETSTQDEPHSGKNNAYSHYPPALTSENRRCLHVRRYLPWRGVSFIWTHHATVSYS